MKYIQELYTRRHCGGPIGDSYTHVSGVSGKVSDHNNLIFFEEISEEYGPEEKVQYYSPSFGPSVTTAQMYLCAYVMDAQDGAWFELDNGAQFLFKGGEWLQSINGEEFCPMEAPFFKFSGNVLMHFAAFGW